jgi:hypothetical protein
MMPGLSLARLTRATVWMGFGALSAQRAVGQVPRLQRVIEIGCADCGDARQFASNWDVVVSAAGDVLVVDRDAPTLRLFDKTGRSVWTRGRPGDGPGEYRYAMRAALGTDGTVQVVDMRLRRLTRLAKDGAVAQSLTVPFFPAGVASRPETGELIFLTDDFRGGGTVQRWARSAETPAKATTFATPTPGSGMSVSPSVAIAPNGTIAFLSSADEYRIHRLSPSGDALPDLVRDVPRPRRTPEELAEATRRMGMAQGATKSALEQKKAGASKSILPTEHSIDLKPHASADGLRYDDAGRLWVRTMRATGNATVFDIFAPTGAFIGELTLPAKVEAFSLAGSYLATAMERDDGVPIVVLWSVR